MAWNSSYSTHNFAYAEHLGGLIINQTLGQIPLHGDDLATMLKPYDGPLGNAILNAVSGGATKTLTHNNGSSIQYNYMGADGEPFVASFDQNGKMKSLK